MKKLFLLLLLLPFVACTGPLKPILSGEIWPDDKGVHINAHGGGILYHDGIYYWYGENKCDTTNSAMVGVDVYSSKNLTDWKNEGVALAVSNDSTSDIVKGCVIERPKVVYNEKTQKFVMWFHLELKGQGYRAARAGVAVSDSPVGPFQFLGSGRSCPGQNPVDMTPEQIAVMDTLNMANYPENHADSLWRKAVEEGLYTARDREGGQMARDQTIYIDEDGKAYHIYSAEENLTLNIAELTDDYTAHTGKFARIAPGGHNEAPAIFKHNGTYWLITSGCTGWAPNEARMYSAPSLWGPWTKHPNPCVGPNKDITFGGQSTYVLPVSGKKDAFIFMADIWRPKHPSDGRYIWLPIQFAEDGTPVIEWMDSWTLDYFK